MQETHPITPEEPQQGEKEVNHEETSSVSSAANETTPIISDHVKPPLVKQCFHLLALIGFVLILFFAILICYADRTNISVAAIEMKKEYNWTNTAQGEVMSGFYSSFFLKIVKRFSLAMLQLKFRVATWVLF